MSSTVTKRSIVIRGRKTSISLEDEFWQGLRIIAKIRDKTLSDQVGEINAARSPNRNLSSAIRIFVYQHACQSGQGTAPIAAE